MEERRRSARTSAGGQVALILSDVDVQVLDISAAGVLLQTSQPVEPGMRGCLRLNLWGKPFSADVQVVRVHQIGDGERSSRYGVGAMFVGMVPEHRQLIEQFANQTPL